MNARGSPTIAMVIPASLSTAAKGRISEIVNELAGSGQQLTVFTPDDALADRLAQVVPTRLLRQPRVGPWQLSELSEGRFDVGHVFASSDSLATSAVRVLERSGARVLFDTAYSDVE